MNYWLTRDNFNLVEFWQATKPVLTNYGGWRPVGSNCTPPMVQLPYEYYRYLRGDIEIEPGQILPLRLVNGRLERVE